MMIKSPIGQCSVKYKETELHASLGGKSDGYDYNEQYQCHADTRTVE